MRNNGITNASAKIICRAFTSSAQLYLSIWDIIYGKGFAPATYRAGTGTPVTIDMLRNVPIKFVP